MGVAWREEAFWDYGYMSIYSFVASLETAFMVGGYQDAEIPIFFKRGCWGVCMILHGGDMRWTGSYNPALGPLKRTFKCYESCIS